MAKKIAVASDSLIAGNIYLFSKYRWRIGTVDTKNTLSARK